MFRKIVLLVLALSLVAGLALTGYAAPAKKRDYTLVHLAGYRRQ
ncbi:MAG TPA: hypothetical protein VHR47_10005 [Bacillota bacterium]|nr:hypothetical protein [Bacillota bacterium]